jgi:hypothetical protein
LPTAAVAEIYARFIAAKASFGRALRPKGFVNRAGWIIAADSRKSLARFGLARESEWGE